MQSALLSKLGTENWTSVRGVNNSLPVLKWQKVSAPTANVKLVPDAAFVRSVITTEDGDENLSPTAQLNGVRTQLRRATPFLCGEPRKPGFPSLQKKRQNMSKISSETSDFPNLEKLEYVNEAEVISRMTPEQKARLAALDAAVDEAESDPEQMLTLVHCHGKPRSIHRQLGH